MVVEAKAFWLFEPSDIVAFFAEDLVKKQPEHERTVLHPEFPVYGKFPSSRIPPSKAEDYDPTLVIDKPVQPLNEYMFSAKMVFTEEKVCVNQLIPINGKTKKGEKNTITIPVHGLPYDTGNKDSYYVQIIVFVGENPYYGKARYYPLEKPSPSVKKIVGPVL